MFGKISSLCFLRASKGLKRHFCSQVNTDVIIVGAGPTGLTASCLLSQFGVRSVLLEKAHNVTRHPQAHYVNNRTMEIFHGIHGNLSDEIRRLTPPLSEWRKFIYCNRLTSNAIIFGEVDHFKNQSTPYMPDNVSPEPVAHLSQHKLVPLLLERAQQLGGRIDFGCEVVEVLQEKEQGVKVKYKRNGNGDVGNSENAEFESMSAKYLIAADGANSAVREKLGIVMQGERSMQYLMNVHFISKGLSKLAQRHPAMLYFVYNPSVVLVFVGHNLQSGEFVAQIPYWPPYQSPKEYSNEKCISLIRAAAGDNDIDVDVKEIRSWIMSAQVAKKFQCGHVFLAGDAAHRFPPAGGFGMNTGIQDAHNLSWKLALTISQKSSKKLLDSYETERRKIGKQNTHLSVQNFKEAVSIPTSIGLDPRAATVLSRAMNMSPLPFGVNKLLLETGMTVGRGLSGVWGPLASFRKDALSKIFTTGESLRLQFPKEDLGFTYADEDKTKSEVRPTSYYPVVKVGYRMPHWSLAPVVGSLTGSIMEMRYQPTDRSCKSPPMSSLDLLPYSEVYYTLVLPHSLLQDVEEIQYRDPQLLKICFVTDASDNQFYYQQQPLVQDFQSMLVRDVSGDCLAQIGGGILVRPDGHILVCLNAQNSSKFISVIKSALDTSLGLQNC